MPNMELHYQDRVLEIETERIEVSTGLPQPDPRWSHTDNALHSHRAERETEDSPVRYPTLVRRESKPYWCDHCNDEHTDSWFECPLCGEKITPGTYIDPSPQYIKGPTTYLIDGRPVPKAEGEALLAEIRAASEERRQAQRRKTAQQKAQAAERAMRAEGLNEDQVRRVVDRLVRDEEESQ